MSNNNYRVRNWSQYNQALAQRGIITFWLSEENIAVNSTGFKVFGEGKRKVRQQEVHLAINNETHAIEACELTELEGQDSQVFECLINSITPPIEVAIGDGSYDRFSCYEIMEKRVRKGIFPLQRNNDVTSQERPANKKKASPDAVNRRDESIKSVRSLARDWCKHGRRYHRRSLAETAMFRINKILVRELSSACHQRFPYKGIRPSKGIETNIGKTSFTLIVSQQSPEHGRR